MVARLQTWFARQSLTVKLLVTVPLLAAAVLWSLIPDTSGPRVDPGNRPVLPAATAPAGSAAASTASGAAAPASQSAPAAQATIAAHQEPQAADAGLGLGTVFRTIVSLGVVLGLFVLCAKGLKHVMASASQTPLTSANLRVAETTFVPNPSGKGRSALHLIEVSDRLLLVGATDQQMALLAEFEDEGGHRLRLKTSASVPTTDVTSAAADPVAQAATTHTAPAQPALAAPRFEEALAEASEKGPRVQSARDPELAQMLARLRQTRQRLEEGV